MRTLKVVLATLIAAFGAITLHGGQNQSDSRHINSPIANSDEYMLRSHDVIYTVTPEYPEEAIRKGAQGLVDLAVRFDEDGNLSHVKVLESPDPLISQAVVKAVKQWKVRPIPGTKGVPWRNQGELRFHFVIENGKGKVENPSEDEQKTRSEAFKKFTERFSETRHSDEVFNP